MYTIISPRIPCYWPLIYQSVLWNRIHRRSTPNPRLCPPSTKDGKEKPRGVSCNCDSRLCGKKKKHHSIAPRISSSHRTWNLHRIARNPRGPRDTVQQNHPSKLSHSFSMIDGFILWDRTSCCHHRMNSPIFKGFMILMGLIQGLVDFCNFTI